MPLNALERLRMRLLDLTARNRLIHFRHTKRGSLRIIDELPNQLVEKLLSETEMRFRPIPEPTREELIESGYIETDEITRQDRRLREKPTVEEWAERLGFRTSYEAPVPGAETTDERHTDNAIQTLLYPFALESRLKSLRQASESAIQEMGANILYLAFGFLEWSENINGDLRIAPLFMLPVRLQKGRLNPNTKIYQYTISYSGEDIIPNLSLKEKLRNDFGMALLDLDENTDPEVYFGEVQELIQENQPNWRLRRYITLTLLNFSKLLMYLDLDPSRWPEDDNIIDHRVVGKFLSCYNTDHGQEEDDNVDLGFGEEYSIDETDNIHKKYPLIDDADSSQHSALIDAVDGKNLVIEGPPGTGKSQTITNLIAAAMAQGKKVLFVSEKLAALEVVRHRLDIAGLGEFCLELHSHKSQKRKVLDEIKSRLDKRNHYRMPSEIERDITRYEELKTKLKDYAERINQPWKNTDKTLHQIFMGAVRYREAIGINPNTLNFEGYGGDNLDTNTQRRMEDQVEIFGNIYQAVADQLGGDSELQQHPWYGARNTDLQIFDLDDVRSVLKNWQCSLRNLNEERTELALGLECEQGEIADSLNGVSLLLKDLERLPALEGDELLCQLPVLKGADLGKAEEYLYLFEDIQSRYANLAQMIGPDVLEDLSVVPDLFAGSQQITRLVQPMIQLGRLMDVIDKLTVVQDQLAELDNPLQQIRAIVGEEAASHLSSTKRGFTEFRCFVDLVASLDFRHWTLRDERFDNEELDDLLPNLRNDLERLYTLRDELQCVFCLDPLPSQSDLKLIRETLDSGGVFRWFKGSWRAARKQILGLAMDNQVRFSKLYSLLKKLEEFSRRRQQLDENNYYEEGLGGHLEGLETKLPALESLRDWYKTVRQQYGVGFGPRVALGNAIVALPVNIVRVVHSLSDQGVQEQLVNLLADLAQSEEIFTPASASKLTDDRSLLAGEGNVISNLLVSLNSALSSCQPLVDNATSVEELAVHAGLLDLLKTAVDEWESDDYDNVPFQERLGLGLGVHVDNTTPLSTFRHTLAIASCVDRQLTNDNVRQKIYAKPESSTFNALNELSTQLRTLVEKQETQYEAFAHLVGLERDDWMQLSGDQLDKLIARNNRAMNNPETLHKWLSYVRTRNRIENMGLVGLAIAVEQGDLDIQQVDDACKAKIFDVLAREILREQPELENFSGQSQKAIQKQFRRYDNSLKKLQCEKISWEIDQTSVPAGNRHGRVSTFSELGLLWHVCSLQRPRISIRQLLHRAGGALVALKPCFMMGPMSVAQYLKPGQIKFDLVVMDEASQIKPQDALGAIARGSQLVVVGDPKQLPPTSFFDRVLDDDDGDQDDTDGDQNDTAIEQSESILDATLPMFPAKRLRGTIDHSTRVSLRFQTTHFTTVI